MKISKNLLKLTALIVGFTLWLGLFGKDSIDITSPQCPGDTSVTSVNFEEPKIRGQDIEFVHTILFLYSEYETECYNDSTASYYYTVCDGSDCWDVPCKKGSSIWFNDSQKCPEHWTHRGPTLTGFIEFLRKKQP